MKKILFILTTFCILVCLNSCRKDATKEEKLTLKTKPLEIEKLQEIVIKLKDKGVFDNKGQFRVETDQSQEIAEIMEPLVENGQDLKNELVTLVSNSGEWQQLTLTEKSEIIDMSDEQLAYLAMAYSAESSQKPLVDQIKDCVGAALGLAGIKELMGVIVSAPTVSSAIGILKWMGKRYLSYVGLAWMIWDFVDCMAGFTSKTSG